MSHEYPHPPHKPLPPPWLSHIFWGLTFAAGIAFFILSAKLKNPELSVGLMCLMISMMTAKYFIDATIRERRCRKQTIGHVVEVVRNYRSRRISYRPIVTFTVHDQIDDRYSCDYTVKLRVKCDKHAEGQLYTVFYDPDEPTVVRAEGETRAWVLLAISILAGAAGIILTVAGMIL